MLILTKRAALRVIAALCAVLSIAAPVLAKPLTWAPPVLAKPLEVAIPSAPGAFQFNAHGRDCHVTWPATKHVGSVQIFNCANLVSIGGWNPVPPALTSTGAVDTTNSPPIRILEINTTYPGVSHIEGLLGDASAGGMSDGIDITAPAQTVQIENVRIDGIYGFYDQFHADCVQPFGGVKLLRIDGFTCRTGYQGLSIWPVTGSPSAWWASLYRVNIVSTGAAIWGAHNSGGYLYWPCRDASCVNVANTHLTQVYLQPRAATPAASMVWTGAALTPLAGIISFPGLPIDGHVTLGPPPAGDFVPAGMAGPAYVSPGYAPAP